jgi:hypothetical protein
MLIDAWGGHTLNLGKLTVLLRHLKEAPTGRLRLELVTAWGLSNIRLELTLPGALATLRAFDLALWLASCGSPMSLEHDHVALVFGINAKDLRALDLEYNMARRANLLAQVA